jgi:hypothetical protein
MLYRVCQKGRTPKKLHNLGYLIMEHEENFFFGFGLSLTRKTGKSFWKLQLNYL